MLRDAVTIASKYTFPVVLSRQDIAGDCSSNIGAFVVINNEGWIATAGHIIEQLSSLVAEATQTSKHESDVAKIRADASILPKDKQRALHKLGKLDPKLTRRSGAWWGMPDPSVTLTSATVISAVDVAVGKLEPFDPAWVAAYPKFKDPKKDFRPGMTLCKLGFPFHAFKPNWNSAVNRFEFPPGAVPLPSFPIDGIFTKTMEPPGAAGTGLAYPLLWAVTSTPGLKGQSGGPTFDTNGTVCAIQCRTAHLPLGFDPDVPGKPGIKEHQFLNVGLGVHPETLYGLFNSLGIKFEAAPD